MLSIVLSRKDFREHDQIVSLYSKDEGKLGLMVRGVKKIVSKNSAHLEPFSIVDITVEKGKDFSYLIRVQSVDYLRNIRENLHKSLVASYIVSIVDNFFAEAFLSKIGPKAPTNVAIITSPIAHSSVAII